MAATRELQIQIDDVYACPGRCPGCVLSEAERAATEPDMDEGTLDLVIARLHDYVALLPRLARLNLTYGVADHLAMSDAHLARIYDLGAAVIEAADPEEREHSAVFFTTSLIGRRDKVLPRLEALAARVGRVAFLPIVVLDPALLHSGKFGPVYRDLILATKALFGKVDLSINLSDVAIRAMTPTELYAFAAENGFDEMTINWTPTLGNRARTTGDMDFLADWLLAFDAAAAIEERVTSSFRPVLLRTVHSVMCASDGEGDYNAGRAARDFVPETIRKSIQFDHRGNLLPKFEAIGDVPHSERFGFPTLGNVRDGSIAALLEAGMPQVLRRVVAAHARVRACAACPHDGFCAATGFHVFNHVLSGTAAMEREACPHVGRVLFDHFLSVARREDMARRNLATI